MSDGRSFAPSAEVLSVDDRLAILEQKIPVYIERIQSYDKIIEQFKDFEVQLLNLAKSQTANSSCFDLIKREVEQLRSVINSNHQNVVNADSVQSNKIQNHNDQISQIRDQVKEFSNPIADLKDQLNALSNMQKSFASKIELKDLEDKLSVQDKNLRSAFAVLNSLSLEYDNYRAVSLRSRSDQEENHKSLLDYVKGFEDEIKAKIPSIEDIRKTSSEAIHSVIANLEKAFESKLQAVKSDLSSSPDAINNIKSDIISKLESVALDGSNAVLKATNGATKIAILEKKIENIFLLLNKFELSK